MGAKSVPVRKAVVFDCFGTLIGSDCPLVAYHRLAVGMAPEDARRTLMTQDKPIQELAISLGLHAEAGVAAELLQHELTRLYVFRDAQTLLDLLEASDLSVAVCSNLAAGYGGRVRSLLPQVKQFVFSYEVGAIKPELAIYAAVCARLRVPARQVLFVGDSRRCDVEGPRSAGMRSRHLDRRSGASLETLLKDVVANIRSASGG